MKVKKIFKYHIVMMIAICIIFTLASCSNSSSNLFFSNSEKIEISNNSSSIDMINISNTPSSKDKNILVVYFTWSNNTKQMANYIHEQVGGTISEIVPKIPYPTTSYTEWGYLARDERDNDSRPEIANPLATEIVSQFNTILIGFPIWWHTAPMIIGTFLESYKWSTSVNIYPFFQGASNSNSEYYDNSMAFVRRCAKDANVYDGLYTSSSNTTRINEYLNQNGLI